MFWRFQAVGLLLQHHGQVEQATAIFGEICLLVYNANTGISDTNIQPMPGKVVCKHDAGSMGMK